MHDILTKQSNIIEMYENYNINFKLKNDKNSNFLRLIPVCTI